MRDRTRDAAREADAVMERESLRDEAWLMAPAHGPGEAYALGVATVSTVGIVATLVAMPSWPWWISVLAALTITGPAVALSAAVAVRAQWTGARVWARIAAVTPAVAWLAVAAAVTLTREMLPAWAQWLAMLGYVAVSVGTVWVWQAWTRVTAEWRRDRRWMREATEGT